jgi:competence protein ComGC
MIRLLKKLGQDKKGYVLVETMIALVVVGAVTYLMINNEILPGFKSKWEMMNYTIQNNWSQ